MPPDITITIRGEDREFLAEQISTLASDWEYAAHFTDIAERKAQWGREGTVLRALAREIAPPQER